MFAVGKSYLGLWSNDVDPAQVPFDDSVVGLDHLAFSTTGSLSEMLAFLDKNDIEHSEAKPLSNGVTVITFRDVDSIQVELAIDERRL